MRLPCVNRALRWLLNSSTRVSSAEIVDIRYHAVQSMIHREPITCPGGSVLSMVAGPPRATLCHGITTTDPTWTQFWPTSRFRRKRAAIARLTPPTGYARLAGGAVCATPPSVVLAKNSLTATKVSGSHLCPSGESVVYLRHGKSSSRGVPPHGAPAGEASATGQLPVRHRVCTRELC